jgi:NAD-dependent DNA ligase
VRLRNFFVFNKMEFPKIDILDVRKYLTNAKYISSNEQSYEMISKATGITVPDMDNILERAWFIGNVLAKCWSKKALKHVAPADFSEPEKLMTHYKKEGAPPVSHVSVAELQSRPLDTRFTGTYVVFTGELKTSKHPKMLRTKARAIVAQLGGITNDSIDGHVTHLVTGVQTAGREKSQKEKQAEKDGIILITAAEFFELIED